MDKSSEETKEEANQELLNGGFNATEHGTFLNDNNNSTSRVAKLYNLEKLKAKKTSLVMKSQCQNMRNKIASLTTISFFANMLFKRLPIINVIRTYNLKSFLIPDILSGFTGNYIRIEEII